MSDTISGLASKLRSYWLRDMGAGGGVAITGGGGMTAHALSGAYHTGTLAEAQAPWAVTDTEFGAHTSNPDAHHARQHGILASADHTVTGSQWQIVGLTAANTLGLLTPSSAPGANTVVRTNGSSSATLQTAEVVNDLYVGTLDFGTNTLYEDATYLRVAGSKTVRFAQNIGNANWTVYDAGGADFSGNVNVLAGGDLSVAGSGFYAGNPVLFADSSGGNVGILCTPDPQFALDINGPARAQYWIGPHAIQLKNVLLLAHFDGKHPYYDNYSGEPNAHMGQVATVGGGVIFRPGKFGSKALQMARGTTNYVTNPSFETNTTGWTALLSAILSRTQGQLPWVGDWSLRVQTPGSSTSGAAFTHTTSAGGVWTASAHVRSYVLADVGKNASLVMDIVYTDATSDRVSVNHVITEEWTRLTVTATANAGKTVSNVVVASRDMLSQATHSWLLDGVQLENRALTPYCDGSLGAISGGTWVGGIGHAWTGTAHASTSQRAQTNLTYPQQLDAQAGTVMMWAYRRTLPASGDTAGLWAAGASGTFDAYATDNGTVVWRVAGSSASTGAGKFLPDAWNHLAFTWSDAAQERRLYVNGVLELTTTYAAPVTIGAAMSIGRTEAGSMLDGLVDDFVLQDRAEDGGKILSVYQSDAPVFAETARFIFRATPQGLVWADDEGLWMRDTTGADVLGVYGGAAATKSWGGFTLAAGDLVIGRNAVGSSALMWDQSTGKFGWYGAGNGTPQVEIGTDGRITAINADLSGAITATSGSITGTLAITGSGKIEVGGVLAIDTTGIQQTISSAWSDVGAYRFFTAGKVIESGVYGQYDSSISTLQTRLRTASAQVENTTTLLSARATKSTDSTAAVNLEISNLSYAANVSLGVSGANLPVFRVSGAQVGLGVTAPVLQLQVLGGVGIGGDEGGALGYTTLTNVTDTSVSTGTGTVKMNAATARNSDAWIKVYIGTVAYWLPAWSNIN